jgi:8-hydroxy-5-deazaflavin:NADPH oxidoreductase
MTRITIIGAGNMGRGIGTRLAAGGHALQVLAPTAEHAAGLAEELAGNGASVTGAGLNEQISGDVVVLATP